MISTICDAFLNAISQEDQPVATWVTPFQAEATKPSHQGIFFIKPEATALHQGVDLAAVVQLCLARFEAFGVVPGAIRVLNGNYLAKHNIMSQHYGVINAISTQGRASISTQAEETLQNQFGEALNAGAEVLGGHQLLEQFPEMSAFSLSVINDAVGTTKLAGGTYALDLTIMGKRYLVLNPFHAYQLVPYTTPGRGIIVIEALSDIPWKTLRGDLVGPTNPEHAPKDSIRGSLLADQERLGMASVNQGSNGVHFSAGPLEGMVELCRFFSSDDNAPALKDTLFGASCLEAGLTGSQLQAFADNATINGVPAFDATEEQDAETALKQLLSL